MEMVVAGGDVYSTRYSPKAYYPYYDIKFKFILPIVNIRSGAVLFSP